MPKKISLLSHLIFYCALASQPIINVPDSLSNKNFEYFVSKLESDKTDKKAATYYAAAYLAKAKKEMDWPQTVNAYKCLLHQSKKELRIMYADSMIKAAKHTANNALIGAAFLTKGIVYYDMKRHADALNNYLVADGYISRSNDEYSKYKVKFNIAQIKYYLGFYNEAASLLRQCIAFFKKEDDVPYLSSLHSLGLCYNRLGQYALCSQTNRLGVAESKKRGHPGEVFHFIHSEGINLYFTQNYDNAIGKLKQALPPLIKSGDFANEAVANFYIGKSYWDSNRHEEALPYFFKVDKAFAGSNYIRPDLRESYELLIDYYKENKNLQKELFYIKRLLKADKDLEANYKYLSGKIHKEYDTKKLLQGKARIEASLQNRKAIDITIIGILVLVVASLVYWHLETQKRNRKKFEELMARVQPPHKEKKPVENLDINPEVVAAVLKHLEKFEKSNKFLEPDMSLTKLAGIFDSNTKYVSKIIIHHRGKKSTEYINDLKIDYIIELLKASNRIRNYTNKALAEEAGFSTTQHFTRAFASRAGISPSYFIQEFKKDIDKQD
jgi:AraC-like DNA-binding protein